MTTRKLTEIFIYLIAMGTLLWLGINSTIWETARVFVLVGLVAGIGIIFSFVVKKEFDVPIASDPAFPFPKRLYYIIVIVAFFATFLFISGSDYRVGAASLQLVNVGLFGDFMLTVSAALMENYLFFALIPGVIFSIVALVSKNPLVAFAFTLILSPLIFTVYHAAVYGLEDQAATLVVFIFGAEMTVMLLLFRDIAWAHARHLGNNLGIVIFAQVSLMTLISIILSSVFFWIAIGVIALVLFIRFRKKG